MANVEVITVKDNNSYLNDYPIETKKKNVCAYCRVSTDMEEQKTSYYSQIEHYSNFIKKNKDWKFVGVYADDRIKFLSLDIDKGICTSIKV